MATQPTQNQVPSESPRDLKFNAGKIDEFVNSLAQQYIDRFGSRHYTIEGLRWLAQQAIAQFGYIPVDSFQAGATLTLPNQMLRDTSTGEYYRWDGQFPKQVPAGSNPQSSGGVGLGKWISVGSGALSSPAIGAGDALITVVQPYPGAVAITQHDQNKQYVNLINFGAKGDGVTDDAPAVQAAINSGARRIYVPKTDASYRLNSTIQVSASVVFEGEGIEPYKTWSSTNQRGSGSWFYIAHTGVGFNVKSTISKFSGVEFRQIGTMRNQPSVTGGTFTPLVCDYDFIIDDVGDIKFIDVCLLNAYKGIQIRNGNAGRGWFERVYGQPLLVGIDLFETFDCVRLSNIHFWPFWSVDPVIWAWQLKNTVALSIGRADGLMVNNFFSIHHFVGMKVYKSNGSIQGGVATSVVMSNIFLDNGTYGYFVLAEAVAHTAQITNLNIQCSPDTTEVNAKCILVNATNVDLSIVSCKLTAAKSQAIHIFGDYCRVNLHAPDIRNWSSGGVSVPAVTVENNNNELVVSGRAIYEKGTGSAVRYTGVGIRTFLSRGNFSGTTNTSGDVAIPHNGGAIPTKVNIQINSLASINYVVTSMSLAQFTVRFYNPATGSAMPSTAISFSWQAEM